MILTLEKDVLVDSLVQKLDFDSPGGLFESTASSIIKILTPRKAF